LYLRYLHEGLSALWGVIAIGLFADGEKLLNITHGEAGLFKGKK